MYKVSFCYKSIQFVTIEDSIIELHFGDIVTKKLKKHLKKELRKCYSYFLKIEPLKNPYESVLTTISKKYFLTESMLLFAVGGTGWMEVSSMHLREPSKQTRL